MIFIEMLSYPFLARALLVGVLVSLCAALLGTPLVLKRYSMIGDGLSHVGFGSLAVATALGLAPLAVTVPWWPSPPCCCCAYRRTGASAADAAIALISSGALALGVIVVSLTSGMNMNVSNYMFGSILTVSRADAALSVALCAAVIALFHGSIRPHLRRHLRRDLRRRHRHARAALQHAAGRADGRHRGARDAHDGRAAHLLAAHLPAALGDARFLHLPRRHRLLRRALRGLLPSRAWRPATRWRPPPERAWWPRIYSLSVYLRWPAGC